MAKPVEANRTSRGVSNVVRAWLATRWQKRRRREREAVPVQMPTVTLWGSGFYADRTWFDVVLDIEVDLWGWPEASIEIWANVDGGGYALVDALPSSTANYVHVGAASGEATVFYKSRYRSPVGVLGPFSEEVSVRITM